jgi:hypothetical protein
MRRLVPPSCLGPPRSRSWSGVGARGSAVAALTALGLLIGGGGIARAAGLTVTVSLSPASIAADGASQTTATVTVSPPLPGQPIDVYAPFDPGISIGPVHDDGDGTYTATLTSSRRAEVTQIFAGDELGTGELFPATLTQVGASATSVIAVADQPVTNSNSPVTNEGVLLIATVTSLADNSVSPTGTISFDNGQTPIAGCQSLPSAPPLSGTVSVTCNASFAAASSPADVTAVFSPTAGSLLSGSTSPADEFQVAQDSTSTSLMTASAPDIGTPVTYVARVTPGHAGVLVPSGFVRFSLDGQIIKSCGQRPLDASSTTTCTVNYDAAGTHTMSASYGGDANFSGSDSGALTESAQPVGTIDASMQWKFLYTRSDTRVLQLIVSRAPVGSRVSISCDGRGCPFRNREVAVPPRVRCEQSARISCANARTVNLTPQIFASRLRAHTRVTVRITHPGWTGKAYVFTVRAGLPPKVEIGCVSAGSARIAANC